MKKKDEKRKIAKEAEKNDAKLCEIRSSSIFETVSVFRFLETSQDHGIQ